MVAIQVGSYRGGWSSILNGAGVLKITVPNLVAMSKRGLDRGKQPPGNNSPDERDRDGGVRKECRRIDNRASQALGRAPKWDESGPLRRRLARFGHSGDRARKYRPSWHTRMRAVPGFRATMPLTRAAGTNHHQQQVSQHASAHALHPCGKVP